MMLSAEQIQRLQDLRRGDYGGGECKTCMDSGVGLCNLLSVLTYNAPNFINDSSYYDDMANGCVRTGLVEAVNEIIHPKD